MVFWNTYPLLTLLQAKFNTSQFKSLVFDKEAVSSPTGTPAIYITPKSPKYLHDVREFIRDTFGQPPAKPILDIPEEHILGPRDFIIVTADVDGNIIGCVRYHYMGIFTPQNKDIFCVDCFCIKKEWRKKGVGDYLLTTLHKYANEQHIPHCMFLKEGTILPIMYACHYSSRYVYRELGSTIRSPNIEPLSVAAAYRLMDIMTELHPNIFIVRHYESQNQRWFLYKKGHYKVLICFQNTFQKIFENGKYKSICWATAWFESSNMTDKCREEASRELTSAMYPEFDYVWMDRAWIGTLGTTWKDDGPFSWYLYQWATNINIKGNYCILN
jgi:predicted N-acetyltransferase YhbS